MLVAIGLFVAGICILLLGNDNGNPLRDIIGFILIIAAFIYVCCLVP